MKRCYLYVQMGLFIFLTTLSSSCGEQAYSKNKNIPVTDKTQKIEEIVRLYHQYGGFNGAVLVTYEGEPIYKKGYGMADMEWDIPNKTDTKFQLASVTKAFTAMLIMQLVADNVLELHRPISGYVPDYPKENGDQITIHHLLTHSSGIPNVSNGEKAFRPKEMVGQFSNEPLLFSPGTQFGYSNSGYVLLGYIIETVTGKKYEDVLENRIFKPLHMVNSGFYRHKPVLKKMSSGYHKWYGDYFDIDYSDESSAYAAGAIYSTVEDMYLWDQALYTESLLPKKYLDLIFVEHMADPEYGGHYGYGWELIKSGIGNTNNRIATIGHGGSINGYRASFKRIPSSRSSIILLNNTNHAFLNAMTTAILGILEDEPYDFPKKPLAQFMVEVLQKEGVEKGVLFYKAHKDKDDYYISEQELIIEGYRLLHAGNAKDAAEVFKLSTEVFPDKDNPYDSYAEALMALEKNEEAIQNYKKSLQLNPNNTNAVKMLEKLGVPQGP